MRRAGRSAALLLAAVGSLGASRPAFESSVVGLTVTYQQWDQDRPWAKRVPQTRRPLAVVVPGPYLLTTAQMVADGTLIEAEPPGGEASVAARVILEDPEADLALLTVDEPGFFDRLVPARLATSMPMDGTVSSVRWRGRQIEISTSRVSRVEVQASLMGSLQYPFLIVTTDLRGGGWSEPVFAAGRLIGLTVSQDDQNMARVLPAEMVKSFLDMAKEAEYAGYADFAFAWQVNEDPAAAAWLGLPGAPRGVIVASVPWGGSPCGRLFPGDILLALDGHPIDASGYYRHPRYRSLLFTNITTEGHRAGDVVEATVWRRKRMEIVSIPLRRAASESDLIPGRRAGAPPAYAVMGGLVFRELDGAYLRGWGEDWRKRAPLALQVLQYLSAEDQAPGRRRVVLLSGVLPAAYNLGYHDLGEIPVESVNGIAIDTMAGLVEALARPQGEFHRIRLQPNPSRLEIILDAATFEAASRDILAAYRIPEQVRLSPPLPDLGPPCGALP